MVKAPRGEPAADASATPRPPGRRLVLGLGNPGEEYRRHRHNIGFQVVETFARQHGIAFDESNRVARIGEGLVEGVPVVLAKPKTYVNRSGDAAAALLQRYHLTPRDLIVVYDELDLPLGRIRVRERGSSGGHNGVRHIIERLGTQDFPRIRVGIGRPPLWESEWRGKQKEDAIIRWVLSGFRPDEEETVAAVRERASAALLYILKHGVERAMNYFNNDKNFV